MRAEYMSSSPSSFLNCRPGWPGLLWKRTIGALGVPLNFGGQVVQQTTAGWSSIALKQIGQRQRLGPLVFLEGFSRHAADHIAFLGKLLFPDLWPMKKFARIWDAIASCSSGGRAVTFSNAFSRIKSLVFSAISALGVDIGLSFPRCVRISLEGAACVPTCLQ